MIQNRYVVLLTALLLCAAPSISWALDAALLPVSRAATVGNPVSAFAAIINSDAQTATNCSISLISNIQASFSYQATDPATNTPTGTPNTPVNIPANNLQTFVVSFTPSNTFNAIDVRLNFDCTNTSPAPIISGVNTLLLSSSSSPVPDIVALAATIRNDGIVHIPTNPGTGVFSVATVNVGASGMISASADTANSQVPVTVTLCQTNPATAQCINPSSPTTNVSVQINSGATPTFSIFVEANDRVTLDPANKRVFVRFKNTAGVTRGSTSVAVEGGSSPPHHPRR